MRVIFANEDTAIAAEGQPAQAESLKAICQTVNAITAGTIAAVSIWKTGTIAVLAIVGIVIAKSVIRLLEEA